MGLVRVWNITDDARHPDVVPHNRMVLGKTVKPGRAVRVDAERLAKAHKVKREVEAGYLHVGDTLPKGYSSQKKPPRAVVDARIVDAKGKPQGAKVVVARAHGEVPTEAIAADAPKAVENMRVAAPAKEEKAEEPMAEETTEETSEDDESSGGRRKKRGK